MSSDDEESFLSINNESIFDITLMPMEAESEISNNSANNDFDSEQVEQCDMASIKPPKPLVVNSDQL
jgi:hypothetical protein